MTSPDRALEPAGLGARLAYRALVATAPIARHRLGAALWDRSWSQLDRRATGTCHISLHGRSVMVNVGHPYPAFIRRWPSYNQPLVALVRATAAALQRPTTLVDVGASIGDTALLVEERCAQLVDEIWCIEGDDIFAELLEHNVRDMPSVHAVHALAGDGAATVPSLVRTHAGSATPQGADLVPASTLDDLVASSRHVDVVKIDTDGYDGRVLQGASRILDSHRPVVQFEWHPALATAVGVPVDLAFLVLAQHGYGPFLWFDKFGTYERTDALVDPEYLAERARWCVEGTTPAPDWHYDVIALPPDRGIDADAVLRSMS